MPGHFSVDDRHPCMGAYFARLCVRCLHCVCVLCVLCASQCKCHVKTFTGSRDYLHAWIFVDTISFIRVKAQFFVFFLGFLKHYLKFFYANFINMTQLSNSQKLFLLFLLLLPLHAQRYSLLLNFISALLFSFSSSSFGKRIDAVNWCFMKNKKNTLYYYSSIN